VAAVGDIIEVKDFQALSNIAGTILNVYHFQVSSVAGSPVINNMGADFLSWWYTDYLPPILAIQSGAASHIRIEVTNLMHYATEFGTFTPAAPVAGTVASEYNSPTAAWSFELVRNLRTTRNGSKRIPGVPEAFVANNVAQSPAPGLMPAVETMMGDTQTVGTGSPNIIMIPVIIRKPVLVSTPPTVINLVSSVTWRGLGSQTSRKQLL